MPRRRSTLCLVSQIGLRPTDRPAIYERRIGVVRFDMEDDGEVIPCIVSDGALLGRVAMAQDEENDVEALFAKYRSEVEKIAAHH